MPTEVNNAVYYNQWWWDEQYTPAYWVEVLLPYIQHLKYKKEPRNVCVLSKNYHTEWVKNIIRCPFDKQDSQFVKVLTANWFDVVYSHIDNWQDFFQYEPDNRDVILSNPPYKKKRTFRERSLDLKKPFALLLPLNILSDSVINVTMKQRERELQLLIPSQRMRFYNAVTGETWKTPTFKAAYFWVGVFEQQIILAEMNIPKITLPPTK